ncbi:helix-turn-helix domain-containing protein [Oceanobacillus salinisoli]|uniref:helix-turn-helix domain-containing protein n=1 Tax=Oceanobacillus salinisoli TaxID=2678611 RepID=UPI0012E30A31|nr:helix-turn-helix domain-containing protein [Oceanobacillus salinisoli]
MDIGARLKEARVSKGLSLDELQELTKIQKRYLSAIEEGKLEVLPGKFYARAFIKEYANVVGIDPSELLEEHKEEIPKTEEEPTVEYSRMQRTRKENHVEKNSRVFSVFPTIIVVLLVIGILFVFWYFRDGIGNNAGDVTEEEELNDTEIIINNPNDLDGDAAEPEDEEEGTEEAESEELQEDENQEGEEEEEQAELTLIEEGTGSSPKSTFELNNVGDELTVVLETEGNTWLDVRADDETLISENFTPDRSPEELDLSGAEQIYFNIGNAPDLKITVNGVELEYPVDPEKYVHQQLWIHINDETE